MTKLCFFALAIFSLAHACYSQNMQVKAYYHGSNERLDNYDPSKLTHIIFCFGHLDGSRLKIDDAKDTALIQKMVNMKSKNPKLKVILSLGG